MSKLDIGEQIRHMKEISILDELKGELIKLNETIENAEKQNQRLEVANYRLQWVMLFLTVITAGEVSYKVLIEIFKWISPYIEQLFNFESFSIAFLSTLATILSVIIAFLITKGIKEFLEKLKLKDSVTVVLKNKDGKVKEVR